MEIEEAVRRRSASQAPGVWHVLGDATGVLEPIGPVVLEARQLIHDERAEPLRVAFLHLIQLLPANHYDVCGLVLQSF